ncbi:MAG: hypothetical protein ACLSAH_20320 [Bilophila wadsworthia]
MAEKASRMRRLSVFPVMGQQEAGQHGEHAYGGDRCPAMPRRRQDPAMGVSRLTGMNSLQSGP